MPLERKPLRAALLWGQSFANKQAGAEQFARLLTKVIPGLEPVFPEDEFVSFPFLSEPSKALAATQALAKRLEQIEPEIVLFNGMYGWSLPKKTPYTKVALCHGTFASFARHAMPWNADRMRTAFIYTQFEKHSYANAELIVSNSKFTQKCLKEDYGLDSVVIPLGVDPQEFIHGNKNKLRNELGLPLDKKVVLFVGRADYYKGFDIAEGVAKAHPEWRVVAVTSPKGNSTAIDCRGPLLFSEVVKYYAACDVVLYPSRFESFGLVTIEALMAGKPVVTTPFGVALEIDHPYCVRVDAFTSEAFSRGIQSALALKPSPSLAKTMDYYTLKRFAQDYRKVLEALP